MRHPDTSRLAVLLGMVVTTTAPVARPDDVLEPRPVLAWSAGPLEVRVAFDGPVAPEYAGSLVGEAIAFPGRDPYLDESEAAGYAVRIAGVRVLDHGRTLVLATDPHPLAATYTLPPRIAREGRPLTYDLHGVEAAWYEGDGYEAGAEPAWSGWWPELDPRSAREATVGSLTHERGFEQIASGPGTLTLRALVPLPDEASSGSVRIEADRPFEATLGFESAASEPGAEAAHRLELTAEVFPGQPAELNVTIATGGDGLEPLPVLSAWRIDGEAVIALERDGLQLPWAPMTPPYNLEVPPPPYNLDGGDPIRGRAVFLSEVAKCSSCHKVGGAGGDVGPALDKLAGADPARIYRDLADPSAAIAPEYVTYTVAATDGRVAVGVVRAEGTETLRVLDTDAKPTLVEREAVEDLQPSGTSVMPVGLAGALGEERVRDLIAYLRTSKGPGAGGE